MAGMNRQLSLPALQTILRDFERQNERMDQTSDVMGDAIDDAFEQEGEQEESEELVSQARPAASALLPCACSRLRRARRCSTKLVARLAHSCWTRRRAARPPRRQWPHARRWLRPPATTAWTATCSCAWTRCGAASESLPPSGTGTRGTLAFVICRTRVYHTLRFKSRRSGPFPWTTANKRGSELCATRQDRAAGTRTPNFSSSTLV